LEKADERNSKMPVDMKKMIASTFAQMAKERSIDKVTVKDLVERCGISRQAFYYHFQDILEVMEWSIRQILQRAMENSFQSEDPQKAIEGFIGASIEHGDLLTRLLDSQHHVEVERIFVEAMRESIRKMICRKKPDLTMNYQDLEVTLNFYAYGIAGAVFECCKDARTDTERLSHQLYQLMSGRLLDPER
jgi:AcrR family transcriptional regulator